MIVTIYPPDLGKAFLELDRWRHHPTKDSKGCGFAVSEWLSGSLKYEWSLVNL